MNQPSRTSRRAALKTLATTAVGASAAAPWIHTQAQAPKVVRLAHHLSLQSEQHKAAERFGELLKKYSNNTLTVRVLPAAQMGGQREIIESVSLGALEMGFGESSLYANSVSRFGVIALPYLYRDFDHWVRMADGPIGAGLATELRKASNIQIVCWMTGGYRDTYLRTKAIRQPSDFARVKIRLPESPVFVKSFQALGAIPTPIPAPDMYSALQTGVVDAMEGNPEVAVTYKIFEVTKHASRTRHILLDGSFVIGGTFLDGLTADQRTAVYKAAQEAAVLQRKEHFEREASWIAKLKEQKHLEMNDVDLTAFATKLAPLQNEFAASAKAGDLLAQIKAL